MFSMERLSINPYVVRRLEPQASLPFVVDDSIVQHITGTSLKSLLRQGALFYSDYRAQSAYRTTVRFTAYTDAYFYIHPESRDFLPLAIRTNVGNNLIYTPLDSQLDWLLAKIMLEVNDIFHAQTFHLANTHDVAEAMHLAAIRTLSDQHPVLQVLNRCQYLLLLTGNLLTRVK